MCVDCASHFPNAVWSPCDGLLAQVREEVIADMCCEGLRVACASVCACVCVCVVVCVGWPLRIADVCLAPRHYMWQARAGHVPGCRSGGFGQFIYENCVGYPQFGKEALRYCRCGCWQSFFA